MPLGRFDPAASGQLLPDCWLAPTAENEKSSVLPEDSSFSLERAKRLELSTYCMASSRSSQLSYARALTEGWEYGLSGGLSRGEF